MRDIIKHAHISKTEEKVVIEKNNRKNNVYIQEVSKNYDFYKTLNF